MPEINPFEQRYYNEPPERKSLEICNLHGQAHREYGWGRQIDPRWSKEQVAAYMKGYETGFIASEEANGEIN